MVGHPKPLLFHFFLKMSSAFQLSCHEFMNVTALSCAEDTILQHPSTASAFYSLSASFFVMNPEPRGKMCNTNVSFVAEHFRVSYSLPFNHLWVFDLITDIEEKKLHLVRTATCTTLLWFKWLQHSQEHKSKRSGQEACLVFVQIKEMTMPFPQWLGSNFIVFLYWQGAFFLME